jgi:hypothetical protein
MERPRLNDEKRPRELPALNRLMPRSILALVLLVLVTLAIIAIVALQLFRSVPVSELD